MRYPGLAIHRCLDNCGAVQQHVDGDKQMTCSCDERCLLLGDCCYDLIVTSCSGEYSGASCSSLSPQNLVQQSLTTEPRARVTHHGTSCSNHSPRNLVQVTHHETSCSNHSPWNLEQQSLTAEPRATVTHHGTSCNCHSPRNLVQ